MKPEDVKTEWAQKALEVWASTPGVTWEAMAAALAAVIPRIQKEEREACISDLTDDGHHSAIATLRARGEP